MDAIRAHELVQRKIKRCGKITTTELTNSFHGRIHGIKWIVDDLVKEGFAKRKMKANKYGRDTTWIVYIGPVADNTVDGDENPYADLMTPKK